MQASSVAFAELDAAELGAACTADDSAMLAS